jgi:hypothetical protein
MYIFNCVYASTIVLVLGIVQYDTFNLFLKYLSISYQVPLNPHAIIPSLANKMKKKIECIILNNS